MLLLDLSVPGRRGYALPKLDVEAIPVADLIPESFLRESDLELPELTEPEVVRYFTQLSRKNHGVDVGFYPLGSCTMKYNPRVNEDIAALPGFSRIHPRQPESNVQGALQLMNEHDCFLAEAAGLAKLRCSLLPEPTATAGLLIIKAYQFKAKLSSGGRSSSLTPPTTNPPALRWLGLLPGNTI